MLEQTRRFGPVRLLPSVTPTQVAVFLFIDLITIGFVVFVNISQAYLMNTKLAIPESIQGTISGDRPGHMLSAVPTTSQ